MARYLAIRTLGELEGKLRADPELVKLIEDVVRTTAEETNDPATPGEAQQNPSPESPKNG